MTLILILLLKIPFCFSHSTLLKTWNDKNLPLTEIQDSASFFEPLNFLNPTSNKKDKDFTFTLIDWKFDKSKKLSNNKNQMFTKLHLKVRDCFKSGKIKDGQAILNQILKLDSLSTETHYLYAESALINGKTEFWQHYEFIKKYGNNKQQSILENKLNLLLGTKNKPLQINKSLQLYPRDAELQLCKWLNELENGNWKECYIDLEKISNSCLFAYQPYKALYYTICMENKKLAKEIRTQCKTKYNYTIDSKFAPLLNLPLKENSTADSIELPFAWSKPYMLTKLKGKNGTTCQLCIDSGTGFDLITLHTKEKGQKLSGTDSIVIKDGIHYMYMDQAEDMHYKLANYSNPDFSKLTTGYFNGSLKGYDGCISPTAFRPYAMHIDPIHEKIFLRSPRNMNQLRKREKGKYFTIPYIERGGWIFVPCKVNEQEMLMLVETGSANVHLNNYSVNKLGLSTYQETEMWKGKEYEISKVDFTIELGEMEYKVNGGVCSDFILGNLHYGLASAGDLGPVFFKHFAFIIDPFKKELIIFRENNKLCRSI